MIGNVTKKAVFSLVMAAFALLAIEVLIILCEPWLFRGFYEYDRELGFRVRPGADGSNRFGFNDRDYPLQKEPGAYRIVFAGDSFSWMGGQEWNYTVLLERLFEEHFGAHRVDVINTGYSMTATGEQLAMLRKFGLQYNPDRVVLGFFAGNDVCDAVRHRKRIVVGDMYFDIDARNERLFLGRPMVGRWRLAAFVKQRWKLHTSAEKPRTRGEPIVFEPDVYLEVERQRMQVCNTARLARGDFAGEYGLAFENLAAMQDLLAARNIGFTVAIYPDEFQVSGVLASNVFAKVGLDPADYDLALVQKKIGAFLAGRGVPYVDLLDPFLREAKERDLYLPRNTHWNEAGNRLAAQLLFDYLLPAVERGWAPHAGAGSLEVGRFR
ncbi:MAG: GDSL-type esterase/lipase family protein [bacterium]